MTGRRGSGHVRARTTLGAVVAAGLALGACTGAPAPTPTTSATESAVEEETPIEQLEAEREALATELASLRATLDALRGALDEAAAGDRDALERAGRLLAADLEAASDPAVARAAGAAATIAPDPSAVGDGDTTQDDVVDGGGGDADTSDDEGDTSDDEGDTSDDEGDTGEGGEGGDADGEANGDVPAGGLAPLLPGPVVSRATTVSYGDLLTTTLAAARSAGREGEPIVRFLEAPLAGALGTWQRAPDDQLAAIAEAGRTVGVDVAATAVLGLDGEASRALAWVVHGLTTDTAIEEVALRAAAHLAVIETALEEIS